MPRCCKCSPWKEEKLNVCILAQSKFALDQLGNSGGRLQMTVIWFLPILFAVSSDLKRSQCSITLILDGQVASIYFLFSPIFDREPEDLEFLLHFWKICKLIAKFTIKKSHKIFLLKRLHWLRTSCLFLQFFCCYKERLILKTKWGGKTKQTKYISSWWNVKTKKHLSCLLASCTTASVSYD